ncbi:MAG: ATP synthase F1 subunit gamma [Clostridiales bacterium]|nr:ATP synthase F1 subunit gamma [Clostridiales bacterium]
MGADIKSLRIRIRSVDSTLHLTRAMGLVASSKIRRATQNMGKSREYIAAMNEVMDQLRDAPECVKSPYMQPKGEGTRLIVIAGDRGLAGGYNANVFRLAATEKADLVIPIGKRACDRFGKGYLSSEHFSAEDAQKLAEEQCQAFLAGEFARLGILYTRYQSMMTQVAEIRWVLPLTPDPEVRARPVIFEPDERTVLDAAVPSYVGGMLAASVRESFASEVAARRMAMDSAGKNAQEMIDRLQLQYNRARQNSITQEITEIVAGSGL